MKTYFKIGNYSVEDYKDTEFAKYMVTNTSRCFNELEEAILYAIACSYGKRNDSQIMAATEMFLTYVNKD